MPRKQRVLSQDSNLGSSQSLETPLMTGEGEGSKSDTNQSSSSNLRPIRSRKDRPCDYCRRLKHTCRILVRGEACTNCERAKRECTFQQPPRQRHQGYQSQVKRKRNDSQAFKDSFHNPSEGINVDHSEISGIPLYIHDDTGIPMVPVTVLGPGSNGANTTSAQVGGTGQRSSLHSSLAAIFEVEDNASDDSAYYASLDLEINDVEEHHYLGPGALMHLTLNADQNDSADLNWLNLFIDPQGTAESTTTAELNGHPDPGVQGSGGGQPPRLSYRQVADPKKPVYFLKEPSKVYGLSNASYEAEKAWKVAEEILSHNHNLLGDGQGDAIMQQLINVFVNTTLPALPMINKIRFQASIYAWQGAHPFPHALLVGILAHSAVTVPTLRNIWKDLWAIVLNLLDNEYRHPRLQTLQLAILDIWGRPNLNAAGNHMAICRAIGAAQMLGLHKDSSHWRLPKWERSTRKRIWWLIYVADKWNSLTYGRPSNIPMDTIVPLPTLYDNDDGGQSSDELGSGSDTSFILMCRMTTVLDSLLPILSDSEGEAHDRFTNNRQIIMSVAMDLNKLEENNALNAPPRGSAVTKPGMASLALCHLYLSVRLASLSLDEVLASLVFPLPFNSHPRASSVSHHVTAVIRKVVEFLEGLNAEQFGGFWTPWSSLQLTHSMSLALRLLVRLSSIAPDPGPTKFPASAECFNLIDRFLTVLVASESIWEVAGDALGKMRVLISSMPDLAGLSDLKEKIGLGERQNLQLSENAWTEWLSLLGMEWLNENESNNFPIS